MGVNFIKIHEILVISKNCKICSEIKFEIENVKYVRRKLWVENFESMVIGCVKYFEEKSLLDVRMVDGWVGGRVGKPG